MQAGKKHSAKRLLGHIDDHSLDMLLIPVSLVQILYCISLIPLFTAFIVYFMHPIVVKDYSHQL